MGRRRAGCIPIRPVIASRPVDDTNLQLLLISSRKNAGHLVFPKGGIEEDEAAPDAAMRETWEEAGIRGHLHGTLPSTSSSTSSHLIGSNSISTKTTTTSTDDEPVIEWFVLHVTEIASEWPEKDQRQRHWMTIDEALALGDALRPRVRELLARLSAVLEANEGLLPGDCSLGGTEEGDTDSLRKAKRDVLRQSLTAQCCPFM